MPRRRRDRSPTEPRGADERRAPHLGADGAGTLPFGALAELTRTRRPPAQNPIMRAWEEAHAPRRRPSPVQQPAPVQDPAIAPADLALLQAAMADVQPLAARHERVEAPRSRPAPVPLKRHADEHATLHDSLHAPLSFEDRLDMGDEAAFLRPGLPRRVLADLRRGRWVLQGEVDLHGLNREEARAALARFLQSSLQQGRRCVRVIHGKGLGSPGGVSILKQLSRGWLAQREEILAFCQAGPHAGGGGALLVLLRAPGGAREGK
ncbi:Smr/MutS family protein [Pseudothauera rhizosphaerae]|uniref:DNA mismatch repair protein MutS n=1 Tax=Pseudothauera rhizosphaerae TaxID=2565932 RepID=A0A4S4AWT8_9RHOO|nr:Smr/MutS family protein [Pseudothauera rhizosphaerae]THF64367.1 DNA mismatch repair protein MutS [Pseudothauera rhizosphaerae]